jgi:hypothetical protein
MARAERPLSLAAEKFDVNVGAEPNVVGQIPADMVWVRIDHDVVAIPKPVVAVGVVGWGNAEEEAVKAEAFAAATSETVDMRGTKGAWKMSVLPGTVEVVICIVPAGIMADPAIGPGIHVGRIGMSRLLGKIAGLAVRWRSAPAIRAIRRSFGWRSAAAIRAIRRSFGWRSAPTIRGNRRSFGWRRASAFRDNRCAFGRASRTRCWAACRDMPATDWSAARTLSSSTARSCTTLSLSALLCKNRK